MTSPVEFFNRRTRTITQIVDETFFRLMESTAPIDRLIPTTSYSARELLLLKMTGHRPTIASLVAEEQEIPQSRPRMTLSEELLTNCKVGKQIIWKAKDFELLQKMQLLLSGGGQGTQAANAIEKHYFGMVADLVPSIYEKALALSMLVATTGACVFEDPLSGAEVELTYPTVSAHMPAALAGNARWSQPTTCTPLANLESHARTVYDSLGVWLPFVVMHFTQLRQIADSTEAKIAKLRMAGADSTTPDVTGLYLTDEEVIAMILQRTRAREVILFDAQYSEEAADGTVTDKYFLPENYYLLARERYIEKAFVPTVERNFQPGLYQNTRQINDAPRVERSVAVGNFIPAVFDARYIAARKVA